MKPENPITIEDLLAVIQLTLMDQQYENPAFKELDNLLIKLKEKKLDKLSVNHIPFWKTLISMVVETSS